MFTCPFCYFSIFCNWQPFSVTIAAVSVQSMLNKNAWSIPLIKKIQRKCCKVILIFWSHGGKGGGGGGKNGLNARPSLSRSLCIFGIV